MPEATANAVPGSPLTDAELRMLELGAENGVTFGDVCDYIGRLVAEVRRLRAQVTGHAERIAAQHDLLQKPAEKPADRAGGGEWSP